MLAVDLACVEYSTTLLTGPGLSTLHNTLIVSNYTVIRFIRGVKSTDTRCGS